MSAVPPPLISVCVCTYHRHDLLEKLLASLAAQRTDGKFEVEVVVVDNDRAGGAQEVVEAASRQFPQLRLKYAVEPTQGISYARNRTVALAAGDYLAFIDDDEYAEPDWLAALFETLQRYAADAVFGPVLPKFPAGSPTWAIRSGLFDRLRFATGTQLTSGDSKTGNALLRAVWPRRRIPTPFDVHFAHSGGEDHDFFVWMEAAGGGLFWCDTAVAYEEVPLARLSLRSVLKRRFRASVTYWRGINRQRPIWRVWLATLPGAIGGTLFFLLGLFTLPLGLHRSIRLWVKGVSGYGRLASLSSIRLVGYGEKHG